MIVNKSERVTEGAEEEPRTASGRSAYRCSLPQRKLQKQQRCLNKDSSPGSTLVFLSA